MSVGLYRLRKKTASTAFSPRSGRQMVAPRRKPGVNGTEPQPSPRSGRKKSDCKPPLVSRLLFFRSLFSPCHVRRACFARFSHFFSKLFSRADKASKMRRALAPAVPAAVKLPRLPSFSAASSAPAVHPTPTTFANCEFRRTGKPGE